MLERYYLQPRRIERIRACWFGEKIDLFVQTMADQGYRPRFITRRVLILEQFAEFTAARRIGCYNRAEAVVEAFADYWLTTHVVNRPAAVRLRWRDHVCGTIQSFFISVMRKSECRTTRVPLPAPFLAQAPGFFDYLQEERGLRPESIATHYGIELRYFAKYLDQIGCADLRSLSLPIVTQFITMMAKRFAHSTMIALTSSLRVFLRYLKREGYLDHDLSKLVEVPQQYRLADIPRSISWKAVQKVLDQPDRQTDVGRRDFAILLLMATYGLRAREVAALTLDDIDWKRNRLHVRERKADHTAVYPLAPAVGGAIIDYLRNSRPDVADRAVFRRHIAPRTALTHRTVSGLTRAHLLSAGVAVRRPGSHTLRHACVQRLVDAGFPLKTIGDYVGHRAASSTVIYAKVQVEALREVALGDGEDLQ